MLAVSTLEVTLKVLLGIYTAKVSLAPNALQRLDFVGLQHRNSP